MTQGQCRCALTVLAGFGLPVAIADAPYFRGLGAFGTSESGALGISSDGSTVVGYSGDSAFRWTRAEGMIDLGDLGGDGWEAWANAVSGDGSVIVGAGVSNGVCTEWCPLMAFRWTTEEGMAALVNPDSDARSVSEDGSVVVGGWCNGYPYCDSFRWTTDEGLMFLGHLPGGFMFGAAASVSADGAVVVGYSDSADGTQAYRWTAEEGMSGLGFLSGATGSAANAVSADGAIAVGACGSATWVQAFRWTSDQGMVSLGDLPGGAENSIARDVSVNGAIIVGRANSTDGYEAFVWDPAERMRPLQRVLVDELGLDLNGWLLTDATGVSDDGRMIVGIGRGPAGLNEAWIAHLGHGCGLPGDLNRDGEVDVRDLSALLANFGRVGDARVFQGDTDGDEDVDLADLATLLASFGSLCP